MSTSPLKSSFWNGAGYYTIDSICQKRANQFFEKINWDAVLSHCSRSRDGLETQLSQNFSIGDFNLVRGISFEDGSQWVIRLKMPERPRTFGYPQTEDIQSTMKTEISTMRYLSACTTLPVPTLHGYDFNPRNEFGAPYMIMDYIDGLPAYEMRKIKDCQPGKFGTPDQDLSFRKQMAAIHAELSSHRFDRIGCLVHDEESGNFTIGPDTTTGQGPWTSSLEFLNSLADYAFRIALTESDPSFRTSRSATLPLVFQKLIASYFSRTSGLFCLTNRDFGAHNLLVNDNFEIVGIIDFDGLIAAPLEFAAQLPRLTGLDRPTPGYVETRPAAIKRLILVDEQLKQYRDLLKDAEGFFQSKLGDQLQSSEEPGIGNVKYAEYAVSSFMFSDASSIIQGLLAYESHIEAVSEKWMGFYLGLLTQVFKTNSQIKK